MMTSIQLAQRLAQKMWGLDFARLPMGQSEELRDAINGGLDEFGSFLPAHRTVRDAPFIVDEPRTVSVNATAGSTVITLGTALPFGYYAAAADLVGRGLVLNGAPNLNRLLSSTALLLPFLGTTGAVAGTLYADGVPLSARVDQLAGEVTWLREGEGSAKSVRHHADFTQTQAHGNAATSLGEPSVWWLESFGGHDAQEVRLVLRLWPLPSARGILTVKLKQFAAPVTMADLHVTTRSLPIDDLEQGHVVTLIASHLTTSPGLREDLDVRALGEAAAAVRRLLTMRANHNPSGQRHRHGTPYGF